MKQTIRRIRSDEQDLWRAAGAVTNADLPDFHEANVLWPDYRAVDDAEQALFLVAECGDQPIARLHLRSHPDAAAAVLLEISVTAGWRRHGCGSRLFACAQQTARGWGKRVLQWDHYVDEEDKAALGFFSQAGFTASECLSVLVDLRAPTPAPVVDRVTALAAKGMRVRCLTCNPADIALATEMQERYFATATPDLVRPPVAVMMRELLARGFAGLVAEQDGVAAGFVLGSANCTTHNYRHVRSKTSGLLSSIAVTEAFRRQGVAVMLTVELCNLCRQAGNTSLVYGGVSHGTPSMKVARRVGGERLRKHLTLRKEL